MSKNEVVIKEFYDMAVELCDYVKTTKITKHSVEYLLSIIMKLYTKAMELPNMQTNDEVWHEDGERIKANVDSKIDKYWELFNPYENDSLVGMMINDDLEDICSDLSKGISQYDKGNIGNAVFEWKDTHAWHWGNHATSVLRVLHQIREDNWSK